MTEQIIIREQNFEVRFTFQAIFSPEEIEQMALLVAKGLTKYEGNLPEAKTDLKEHLENSQTLISKNTEGNIVGFCICRELSANVLDISVISPIVPGVGKKILKQVAEKFNKKPLIVGATQHSRMLGCAISAFGSKNMISPKINSNLMQIGFVRGATKLKGTNPKKIDNQSKIKNYYGQVGLYQENVNKESQNIIKIDTAKSGDAFIFIFQNPNYTTNQ